MRSRIGAIAVFLLVGGQGMRADELSEGVRTALEKATEWEVLSLVRDVPAGEPAQQFRGWQVLGRTTVKDPRTLGRMHGRLEAAVASFDADTPPGRCFRPRHGLRVKYAGKTVDIVVCFECQKGRVYVPGEAEETFYLTSAPGDLFNQVLKAAKVPLPKGEDDDLPPAPGVKL